MRILKFIMIIILLSNATAFFTQEEPVMPKPKTSGNTNPQQLNANKLALKVVADADCKWSVDGLSKGLLKAGQITKIYLGVGVFIIDAVKDEQPDCRYYNEYTVKKEQINTEGVLKIKFDCSAKQPQQNQNTNDINIAMVFVQGGTFTMGCTSEQGSDCPPDAKPSHSVTVGDYYIGKFEITQKQWRSVMGTSASLSAPSYFKDCDDCPVENVSWNDIQEFLTKLNQLTGKTYRLPTEAEWEYAARGGNKSAGYKYSGSNNIDDVAWHASNSGSKTHPVGQKQANELGIYDMSGNVWEWCSDWYGSYSSGSQTDPEGTSSGSGRIGRGGSWRHPSIYCRVAIRLSIPPVDRDKELGFRVVSVP